MPLLTTEAELEEAVLDSPAAEYRAQRTLAFSPTAGTRHWPRLRHAALLLAAAIAAVGVDGYHPYAEDAGIYVVGIKRVLYPGLYGSSGDFIAPYFRWSLFPEWNAWISRQFHVPLEASLLAIQLLTTWLLLVALWRLAALCFPREDERWTSVALTAMCLSVPVAGSSLSMMDPYVTGRSFSTPLALLAIGACLQDKMARATLLLLLVCLCHPLMAIYATGFVLLLWATRRGSWRGIAGLVAAAIAAGAAVQLSQRHSVESAAYHAAVMTRDYYFLQRWHWYELFGLAAPLLLLAGYTRWQRRPGTQQAALLAKTCVLLGVTSILCCILFARETNHSHLIAALQTIRPFLLIYLCMFLLLGGVLGHLCGRERRWLLCLLLMTTGAGLAFVQQRTYATSSHIELPWRPSQSDWTRAFLWIRENTPRNAVVALDADYIHAPGEDAQGFRAIAERASLADQSKDGGAAAAFPQLAERWMAEYTATTGLNHISDAERLGRLKPFHVGWIVLERSAATAMPCPFRDATVKVCRLK